MNAEDLIARVYSHGEKDLDLASTSITSSSYFVPSQRKQSPDPEYGRDDREATAGLEETGDRKASELDRKPCIEIRFSQVPRSSHGVLFGCSRKCDVVLPNLKGLSNVHFCLTFDEQGRFIVRDLGSVIGTQVTYDAKGKGTRRGFNWIVGGDTNAHRYDYVIIYIHERVQFRIVTTKHNIKCPAYIDNIQKFCQGSATAESIFKDLDIMRPDTEYPTGAHTPGVGPLHIQRTIGRGGVCGRRSLLGCEYRERVCHEEAT